MKINIDTAVDQVDVPAIKSRIPRGRQDDVLERILKALYHYPPNRSSWKPLDRNPAGYYKVVFSSGLNDAQDMRIALSYDETTDTVTVMAVGFISGVREYHSSLSRTGYWLCPNRNHHCRMLATANFARCGSR